ncbi:CDP-glycerol glycerophosphotransferase family protein [Paeniglutamicibacter psychrophenolicus]|uniref:CDP-glycerol glycerophosphotransferase n=1 Tax=Paeniglutamicibacter psychrophenolicus TaxID=257454 RepID=A0ABS4WFY6_9MICC|nr:CDP-glycerol glycerophosphotransferase family protein [Paeniglutamicibacter psychrophenolicus]MBP2374484.1 CDP-glycerol glycerophosphotransferase [Paeniglutamicibacter psychrophenolicus]
MDVLVKAHVEVNLEIRLELEKYFVKAILAVGRRLEHHGKWNAAIRLYLGVLRRAWTKSPAIRYRLGYCQFKVGQLDVAEKNIRRAINRRPLKTLWKYQLAHVLRRKRQFDESLELFEFCVTEEPGRLQWRIQWAICAVTAKQHAMAVKVFEDAAHDFPGETSVLDTFAAQLRRMGQRWRELEVLTEALPHFETQASWHIRLAETCAFMSRFDDAVRHYEIANQLEPGKSSPWYEQGFALSQLELSDGATEAYANAVRFSDKEDAQIFGVGVLHQERSRWALAASAYESQVVDPDVAGLLHMRLGECYARLYQWDKAITSLRRSVETDPGLVKARVMLAKALMRAGEADNASQVLAATGNEDGSGAVDFQFLRAFALRDAHDLDGAADTFENVATLLGYFEADDDPTVANSPGERLLEEGREAESRGSWLEAAEAYSAANDRNDSLSPGWFALEGRAWQRVGDAQKANDAFTEMTTSGRVSFVAPGPHLKTANRRRAALFVEYSTRLPLADDVVLFESSHGKSIHCHPYAIFSQMQEDPRFKGKKYVWVFNQPDEIPPYMVGKHNVIFVRQHSSLYVKYLATAGYLINNATFPIYYVRRDGQKYLNTWHGTPLKLMGKLVREGVAEHRNVSRNFLQSTHMIVPNEHTKDSLVRDHDLSGIMPAKVAKVGSPRVDQMVNATEEQRAELREKLGIPADSRKPVVLFAPTWRGQLKDQEFDSESLVNDMKVLGNLDVHLLFRAHRFAEAAIGDVELDATVVPAEVDTNELLAVVDVLLTDYSSVFYDFLPTGRPIVFYTPDLAEYQDSRGLYFEPDTWPGPVLADIHDVAQAIQRQSNRETSLNDVVYAENVEKFASMEDGHATQRALDFFFDDDDTHVFAPDPDERTSLLFFQGPFKPNGIATAFTNLVSALDPEKYRVIVVGDADAIHRDEDAVAILRSLPSHVQLIPRAGYTLMTAEERWVSERYHSNNGFDSAGAEEVYSETMRREFLRCFGGAKFDVVIDYEGYSRFWAALLGGAQESAGKTCIYLHNDMVGEWLLRFGRLPALFALYPKYDALVSVTQSVGQQNKDRLSQRFGLDDDAFVVSDNLIDLTKPVAWSTLEEPAVEFAGDDLTIFANMARLSPEKGQLKLLEAFDEVHRLHPKTRLLLIGDGPLRSSLEREIIRRELSAAVKITGLLGNPFPTLKTADCFVFSSEYEGQGLAMVEAMMLGLPAISTDVVGSRSVLEGGFGLLVENSAAGLSEGMTAYLSGWTPKRDFDPEIYQKAALEQFEELVANTPSIQQRVG